VTTVDKTVEDQFGELRAWLRMHGDYDVRLDLWASYGTYRISVWRLSTEIASDAGVNLDKRLTWALDRLNEIDSA
jgi:hypothetical protein